MMLGTRETRSSSNWLSIITYVPRPKKNLHFSPQFNGDSSGVLEQILQRRQVRCMQRIALVLVQEDLRMLTHQCHGLKGQPRMAVLCIQCWNITAHNLEEHRIIHNYIFSYVETTYLSVNMLCTSTYFPSNLSDLIRYKFMYMYIFIDSVSSCFQHYTYVNNL